MAKFLSKLTRFATRFVDVARAVALLPNQAASEQPVTRSFAAKARVKRDFVVRFGQQLSSLYEKEATIKVGKGRSF